MERLNMDGRRVNAATQLTFPAGSEVEILVNALVSRIRRVRSGESIERHVPQVHRVDCLEVGRCWLGLVSIVCIAVRVVVSAPILNAQGIECPTLH